MVFGRGGHCAVHSYPLLLYGSTNPDKFPNTPLFQRLVSGASKQTMTTHHVESSSKTMLWIEKPGCLKSLASEPAPSRAVVLPYKLPLISQRLCHKNEAMREEVLLSPSGLLSLTSKFAYLLLVAITLGPAQDEEYDPNFTRASGSEIASHQKANCASGRIKREFKQ
ncbi:hypothetical protein T310_3158 [Rasamsonia emersonii CBS 393.64]|uniref:Uncharacterized protein n=1 Tax=Rasamsonia emersonii (strain ATCC 16479 / CBS 393.64 / IMI 116815) TaxID=1408163 RepID=A0A0F4YX43_RASE3|nr:hypothetical protein T310_3158 [Rasamsonia emersonii CBS 393.64]KKA22804.1 hypothetical protein T310_3158 [Rasamsonia emersonii CBS 393.64]